MMPGLLEVDWERVRQAYEETEQSVADIAECHRIAKVDIELRAAEEGWRRHPNQRPRSMTYNELVVRRFYFYLDHKLAQLEARMNNGETSSVAEHETETRVLAQLIRSYEKVTGLADQVEDRGVAGRRRQGVTEVTDEGDDPERLRRELAQRILRLCQERPSDDA